MTFFGHCSQKLDSESKFDAAATAHETQDSRSDTDLHSKKNREEETSKRDTQNLTVYTEETCHDIAHGNNTCLI